MNITKFDIGIAVSMAIAIISMNFMIPALGISPVDTSESDIPELDITAQRFDFAGEIPKNPGGPSRGHLYWDDSQLRASEYSEWLHGDYSAGTYHQMTVSGSTITIDVTQWQSGNVSDTHNFTLSEPGDIYVMDRPGSFEYHIEYEYATNETLNASAGEYQHTVEYRIIDQPVQQQWYDRIPLVGGFADGTEQLAGILGWIGSLVWWAISFVVTFVINGFGILYDVLSYAVGLFSWLIGTYAEITASASGWVPIILAIPGIMLFYELAKIAAIGVEIIWIG